MNISSVISELEKIKKEKGDIPVRLNCDHGQELMLCTWVGVSSVEDDSYLPECGDEGDYPRTVVELQAY